MFPSLCFVDLNSGIVPEDSKEELKNVLSDEEFALISDNSNSTLKFKFKLLELFADKNLSIANN